MLFKVLGSMLATGLMAALGVLLAAYLMGHDWHDLALPSSLLLVGAFMLAAGVLATRRRAEW